MQKGKEMHSGENSLTPHTLASSPMVRRRVCRVWWWRVERPVVKWLV